MSKKKKQTMMCAEELKLNNVRNKKLNSKETRKTSGITLIALVVTIVVLLILAGITISLVFSENGIIAKAKEAAEKTNQAAINEQEQMNEVVGYLENALNGMGRSNPPQPEGPEMPNSWDGNKVNAVESADKVVVPVPKGYTASSVSTENKVSEGFVIYENTNGEDRKEEVNDSNKDTARTTRNQFVWVPVANPSEMYGTDKNGKKWGKLYNFSASGITAKNWTEQDGVISITATSGSGSYREPDVVTGSDGTKYDADNSNLQQAGLESSATANTFKTQLETEFNNMITIDELKNLDNLSSCILSDTFETIAKAVEINTNGIIIILIKFPINVIKKSNIGSNKLADVKLPVVSINVISIGIRLFINPTKLSIEFLTIEIISAKFTIIKVTINIY